MKERLSSAALYPQVARIHGVCAARLAECVHKRLPSPPLHGGEGQGEGDDPVHRNRFAPHPDLLPSPRGEGITLDSLSPTGES
jgi:hypothetical protein